MTQNHGIKPDWMDQTADPGVDFNRYCNGGWIDRTEIPPEYPRWGAFTMLAESTQETLKALLEELAGRTDLSRGSNEQKLADFWAAGMNEDEIERAGATPLAGEIRLINSIRGPRKLAAIVARLHLYSVNALFGFGASPDLDDSSRMIAHASQGGLGLPDRDYYLNTDEKSVDLRRKYVEHITRMLELLGARAHDARRHAQGILDFETELARVSMTKVERRDPEKQRNKTALSDFAGSINSLPFADYLAALGAPAFETINVRQPDFFRGLNELLSRTPQWLLRAYLRWCLLRTSAGRLSSAFVNESFEFYGKTLTGSKELRPRWKRMIGSTNAALGEALGQIYVARYFPPEAKARMLDLVANLREALRETLLQAEWLSDETRRNAILKLDSFEAKIGYPDKWLDYSSLEINRGSFMGNCLRAEVFHSRLNLAKIGQPVDRSEWFMSPQTVNAYYSPSVNQIVFPAAILQPPFFHVQADDAANYGGIGVVIGHEMTHGFDDKGSKFDASGNLRNWWTEDDLRGFKTRVDQIIQQFDRFTVAGGKSVNGQLVAGEAASDLGGVKLAYRALKKVLARTGRTTDANGFTDAQRFFIAFGQLWASKATDEYEQLQVATDPHPPARYRVNGTLAHVEEFAQAFGLPQDAPMMLPPEKRCRLW